MERIPRSSPRKRSGASVLLRVSAILALMAFLLTPVLTQAADPPTLGAVRLSPNTQTLTVGNQAQFTVWVVDSFGRTLPGVSVALMVSGANNLTTSATTTNFIGRATQSYVGSHPGTDTVIARATYNGHQLDSNSVAVDWNPSTAWSVTLSPATATKNVNTSQTITATVRDGTGTLMSNETVQFKVTGANPVGATDRVTNASGVATFSYTGTVAGADTVFAFDDFDNDHVQEAGEPGASATINWIGYNLTLATSGTTAAVGSTQSITATVTDSDGTAVPNVQVYVTVTGVNPSNSVRTTGANGKTVFSYVGTHAGVDTISAYADINGNVTKDGNDPSTSTTITWSTSSLTLAPLNSAAAIGTTQTFTATVKGTNGSLLPNVVVRFTVTGVNPIASTAATTNSNGQATFSYVGSHSGVDTITAYADVDNDNAQDNGEPGASTTITWANATLTLSPLNVTAPATTAQTFTVTVKNTAGNPLNNVTVRFTVTGANPSSASGTTDANGHASYSYTGSHPGIDTVSAYADIDGDSIQDASEPGASTTATWTAANLTLSLSSASATIGTTQTVTATLRNANNQPITGITIRFSITGANPTTVNVVSNGSGQASFSYKGVNAGTDTIHAYGDLDKDGVQDGGDPVSNVTLTWTNQPTPPPVTPSQPAAPKAGCTYFPQTQHNLCAGFQAYWNQFGGLAIYGYPLTEEFQQNGVTVQYFERARFEWHPGAWPARYDVLLGLLGNELTVGRSGTAFQPAAASNSTDCTYFAATGHNLCGTFRTFWNEFGGLAVFGMPISEPFQENGVTVQYFERQRFELHPGAWPQHHDVLLGRVGAEVLAMSPY